MLLQDIGDIAGGVKVEHAAQEIPPTIPVRSRLHLGSVPDSVEGVERDPSVDQGEIEIGAIRYRFDPLKPAACAMKPHGGRVIRLKRLQSLFLRLPATTQVAYRLRNRLRILALPLGTRFRWSQ